MADVATDRRPRGALLQGIALFAPTPEDSAARRAAGLDVAGTQGDLLGDATTAHG